MNPHAHATKEDWRWFQGTVDHLRGAPFGLSSTQIAKLCGMELPKHLDHAYHSGPRERDVRRLRREFAKLASAPGGGNGAAPEPEEARDPTPPPPLDAEREREAVAAADPDPDPPAEGGEGDEGGSRPPSVPSEILTEIRAGIGVLMAAGWTQHEIGTAVHYHPGGAQGCVSGLWRGSQGSLSRARAVEFLGLLRRVERRVGAGQPVDPAHVPRHARVTTDQVEKMIDHLFGSRARIVAAQDFRRLTAALIPDYLGTAPPVPALDPEPLEEIPVAALPARAEVPASPPAPEGGEADDDPLGLRPVRQKLWEALELIEAAKGRAVTEAPHPRLREATAAVYDAWERTLADLIDDLDPRRQGL